MKRIYAFGDSNTYGFDPRLGGMGRYPKDIRWTGVLDLMPEYEVNNQGYNGLSIPGSDSAIASIGRSIKEWSPDLILIMIGSNDLLNMSPASCEKVGIRMRQFLAALCNYIPEYVQRMVLVAPPRMSLGDWTDPDTVKESHKFGTVYESIAGEKRLRFLNACEWELPLCYDGVHLTEEAHLHFAEKIIQEVRLDED
ncbi:SGNH/GDSL hydrolase family protein [Butyrivibrio sp. XPD2006]|uniref:SGNH/GDSL hydrolase family protein n=1 Tax=Butyrivibrio sp. XPD2006 TaxID=1280668 RepID=UPI0003B5E114|nr:SGNH/GDSL hydrolase family protein [Butyrivibrio sp. XPD2006]